MIKDSKFITLKEVLSNVLRHPLLQNVDYEAAIQYAIEFISAVGLPDMFVNKEAIVTITNHRGYLPCDLVSVTMVKDMKTNICLRSTTDVFEPTDPILQERHIYPHPDNTYKVQNQVLITSVKDGDLLVTYKAIPVDDMGAPLVMDNPTYIKALQAYIKQEAFTVLYDLDKIKPGPLQNAQQDYCWWVGKLQSELTIPSLAEMESIKNMWCSLIQKDTEFDSGFRYLGTREYIKKH